MKKEYCTQNDGDCSTCSLVSYGRDCRNKSLAAQELGRMAAGKPKKFSEEEIKKRTERLKKFSRHNKEMEK